MGSSGSAFKDVTFHPLPYDYRCFGVGAAVLVGSGMSPWTSVNHCFRSRSAVCVYFLATGVWSVGD